MIWDVLLQRRWTHAKLPAEFEGFRRLKLQPVGGQRHGVFRLDEYFTAKIGCPADQMTMERWLRLPEYALAEAVNGEVFRDPAGLLTDCRNILKNMPEKRREVFLASRFEGLKYAEIAEKMGLSQKTVEAHMSAAIKQLREGLKEYL